MKSIFKDKEPKLTHGIIAIDPGVRGSIALMTNSTIISVKMPDRETPELIMYELHKLRERAKKEFNGVYPKVIIEHVAGRSTDSSYAISKLVFNYGLCVMACIGLGMKPAAFYPISWKSYMKLSIRQKGKLKVKITESMKKQKTVDFINRLFPWLKFTKQECDSIAIAIFGYRILTGIIKLKKGQSVQGESLGLRD